MDITNKFATISNSGNYYAQDSKQENFPTLEEAEKDYETWDFSQYDMKDWKWSKDGEQPEISIELIELQYLPQPKIDEITEAENDEEKEALISEYIFTYGTRIKTKMYIWDMEKQEYVLRETEQKTYDTLAFSEEVVDLKTGEKMLMKGQIK